MVNVDIVSWSTGLCTAISTRCTTLINNTYYTHYHDCVTKQYYKTVLEYSSNIRKIIKNIISLQKYFSILITCRSGYWERKKCMLFVNSFVVKSKISCCGPTAIHLLIRGVPFVEVFVFISYKLHIFTTKPNLCC